MAVLRAHFDGKVFVPNQPMDLPVGTEVEIQYPPVSDLKEPTLLQKLAEIGRRAAINTDAPTDGAAQHDHYLYGLPKQP